jgi:hypothetical protein
MSPRGLNTVIEIRLRLKYADRTAGSFRIFIPNSEYGSVKT